jgi:DUF1680 family protein
MKSCFTVAVCCVMAGRVVSAREPAPQPLTPLAIQQVRLEDEFWSPKIQTWRTVTIADCFAKFEKDGAFANFDKIRDGSGGEHGGLAWFDGLIYEMIRGAADMLAARPDPELEARLDGYIERIAAAAARDPDGYLNTHTQLTEPGHRWGLNGGDDNLQHDVYNASALIEAGMHYYRATGKIRLLQTAVRLANHMADLMGPPPKKNIVPGHSLGEEVMVNLHRLFRDQPALKERMAVPVRENDYLRLAEFWLENRGNHEGRMSYGSYGQDHLPVLRQETIEGHAVRATLMCAGLAAAAAENGREDYIAAARRLWDNMVQRRMYVIGGLGAIAGHEGFGPDYELPNDGYLETCAAIGAGFFHHNMNLLSGEAKYADELERVLYNGVLSGVSLKGDSYFYENPLAAGRQRTRWHWHTCPCCPPMFLKIMAALPGYVYARDPQGVYVNLFVGSRAELAMAGGRLKVHQETRYPWDGDVRIAVDPERPAKFAVNVRLPAWCASPQVRLNGQVLEEMVIVRGYARIEREWKPGDTLELSLPMPVERIHAHPKVEAARGRVALQRGPVVYCLEGCDNGGPVRNLVIPPDAELKAEHRADFLGGVTVIRGGARALHREDWGNALYQPAPREGGRDFLAIPYYANANREPAEMRVWMAETPAMAEPVTRPSLAAAAEPSASHCHAGDKVSALNDGEEPVASDDRKIPRFTWWDHRGTREWVQYDFNQKVKISSVEVYWWDERRINAHCRVPESWRVVYQKDGGWHPVEGASDRTVGMDRFNRVTFKPVETRAVRLEVQLQAGWSGGILEWRAD